MAGERRGQPWCRVIRQITSTRGRQEALVSAKASTGRKSWRESWAVYSPTE
jgi:hypothetical protein